MFGFKLGAVQHALTYFCWWLGPKKRSEAALPTVHAHSATSHLIKSTRETLGSHGHGDYEGQEEPRLVSFNSSGLRTDCSQVCPSASFWLQSRGCSYTRPRPRQHVFQCFGLRVLAPGAFVHHPSRADFAESPGLEGR